MAVNDPMNFFAIEEVRQFIRMPLELRLADSAQIIKAIDYHYSEILAKQAGTQASETLVEGAASALRSTVTVATTANAADEAPVVRLLNSLLLRGYNTNASDIHIEPQEGKLEIRMRVDGMLVDFVTLAENLQQSLIARIKILSDLDIAEKRTPQDGHFRMLLDGIDMNLRVSVIPTVYGEKAVIRFLNSNTKVDNEGNFGMPDESYRKMIEMLKNPHGIIYMTGPTGSGKTSTLYMILEYLAVRQINITTIEDPVERNLPRTNQIQVNVQAGVTFGVGLRSILRQDPDVIMVGETRDTETAEISVRSAITGHLVLSTLHTNDAISTVVRLEDMGIPRHLIANSLVGIVAQRLVKKICPDCGYEYVPDESEIEILGSNPGKLRKGRGCHVCNGTGYKGRTAIHEIIVIDRNIKNMITKGTPIDEMFDYIRKTQDMKTLRESVTQLALAGITSVEEVVKTTYNV